MKQFNPLTKQHLGYYVYALVDPKDGKIFYIGKGHDDRVFAHARDALKPSDVTPSDKIEIIRRIIKRGEKVKCLILRHGLREHEALIVESVLIDLLTNKETKQRKIDAKMTNLQCGHDMRELGIRNAKELDAQYSSTPLANVNDKLVIININRTYKANISIYDATRKSWRLSKPRADQADYVLSEYQGVIRAVFKMDDKKWQPEPTPVGKPSRYFFTGYEVTDPAVLSMYMNKQITKRHGDSYPIHYRNI